ncbi:thioredoxin-disulfide reductase [Priestia megaterium]|uniref:thioredoxin-disulfide reductase n=1 Tax=Priestia megaterium TaxID=1404 RepID=UPI002E1F0B9C|nr:thioredoxin-disulfide reductase [Priestia megaterium]MED4284866.1 thioredoxin-disulfide reductase [Priestia megaterium]
MNTSIYDVIIIGAGPAGLTAALYASRGNMKTLIIERGIYGGQMQKTEEIENYPAFKKILGPELSRQMYDHAIQFGAEYTYGIVSSIKEEGLYKRVIASDKEYITKTIIIAAGADYKKLGIPGEKELTGRGVSYCAVCDGAFFKGKEIAVIGGGDSAVEEANYLTKFADRVTIIHRKDKLKAQQILQNRILNNPKVDIIWNTVVENINGIDKVSNLEIKNLKNNEINHFNCDGVFIYVGMNPLSKPFKKLGITNPAGCIPTDEKMETKIKGIYAAGDIREKYLRQVITASGDGSIAAQSAQHYVEELDEKIKALR